MLNVPGAGLTLNEELALANKADRVGNIGGFGYVGPGSREQDSPFEALQRYVDLQKPPQVNDVLEKSLLETASRGVEDTAALNVSTAVNFYRASDNSVMTALTIQTDNSDLKFEDDGSGIQTARLNIYAKITTPAGRRIRSFEARVTPQATAEELNTAKERKSAYQRGS